MEAATLDRRPLASPFRDWLWTFPCLLITLLGCLVTYPISCLWLLQFTGVKRFQDAHGFLLKFIVCLCLALKLLYVKYFQRAKVVFVCYPPEGLWEQGKPIYKAADWFWKERQLAICDLSWKKQHIGYVLLGPPLSAIKNSPRDVQYCLEFALHTFKGAKLALGGQLPAVSHQLGIPTIMHKDIVNGRVGTVALARQGAKKGLHWVKSEFPERAAAKDFVLCVIGGGGYTGKEIAGSCSDLFSNIYMVDSKFEGKDVDLTQEKGGAAVMGTFDQSYVGKADVVLVFLPNGDLVEPYIKYAHEKQIWIDDTHPPMTKRILKMLGNRTKLTRLAAYSKNMGMWPKLPAWNPHDLPGCLLTAVVVSLKNLELKAGSSLADAKTGKEGVLEFIDLAEEMGVELGIFPIDHCNDFKPFGINLLSSEGKKQA